MFLRPLFHANAETNFGDFPDFRRFSIHSDLMSVIFNQFRSASIMSNQYYSVSISFDPAKNADNPKVGKTTLNKIASESRYLKSQSTSKTATPPPLDMEPWFHIHQPLPLVVMPWPLHRQVFASFEVFISTSCSTTGAALSGLANSFFAAGLPFFAFGSSGAAPGLLFSLTDVPLRGLSS